MPQSTAVSAEQRRALLAHLSRDRLKAIADHFGLAVKDRRSCDSFIEAVLRADVGHRRLLGLLKREELKIICGALGLEYSSEEEKMIAGILEATRERSGHSGAIRDGDFNCPELDAHECSDDQVVPLLSMRSPTRAFGRVFTHLPEHARDDLLALERECAVYTDHMIRELNDFRHVRLAFTREEAEDFARRTWCFELFLRADCPKWAREVPGIDPDVAAEADAYCFPGEDPPYHCFCGFMGKHIESIICGWLPERRTIIDLQGRESAIFTVNRAIGSLTPAIRSFNGREKGLMAWRVAREDDVRDILHVMLKPCLFDISKEEPTPSKAGTYKYVDLCSRTAKLFIEVKWIGKKTRWKRILDEIRVDTQCYPAHPACQTLVFVVVDAVRAIPDPRLIEKEMSGPQSLSGREIDVRVMVVEP